MRGEAYTIEAATVLYLIALRVTVRVVAAGAVGGRVRDQYYPDTRKLTNFVLGFVFSFLRGEAYTIEAAIVLYLIALRVTVRVVAAGAVDGRVRRRDDGQHGLRRLLGGLVLWRCGFSVALGVRKIAEDVAEGTNVI